jgi:hypothetical protein
MKIVKKIWLLVFEFKVKRVPDNEMTAFLTKELIKELCRQGYELDSQCDLINIWIHRGNELSVVGLKDNNRIECGNLN